MQAGREAEAASINHPSGHPHPSQETCRGWLVEDRARTERGPRGCWPWLPRERCWYGNAQAALSTPTPGRDERGATERSAPSND